MGAARCTVDRGRNFVLADIGQDWVRRQPRRPTQFACPSITIEYWAGSVRPIVWNDSDWFKTNPSWNAAGTGPCPGWRGR